MSTSDKTNPAGFEKLAEEYAAELKYGYSMVVMVTANSIVLIDIPLGSLPNTATNAFRRARALSPTEAALLFTRICARIEDGA